MGNLMGTKTEKNLLKAFAIESEQRSKYSYFSEVAIKEGYNQIAEILNRYSINEEAHAKIWYDVLNSGVGSTSDNILEVIEEEIHQYEEMYVEFAKDARKEGFDGIADLFDKVSKIQRSHEEQLNKIIDLLDNERIFSREKEVLWECENCGYTVVSKEAPKECEVCKVPQSFFRSEIK